MNASQIYGKLVELICGKGYIVACTGSPLRGDDRIGLVICEKLLGRGFPVVLCEYGLESCLGEIIERNPRGLIIIDAVYLEGACPGEVVWATLNDVARQGGIVTTHNIPLHITISVLKKNTRIEEVFILGVNISNLDYGLEISEEVLESGEMLVELLSSVYGECARRSG